MGHCHQRCPLAARLQLRPAGLRAFLRGQSPGDPLNILGHNAGLLAKGAEDRHHALKLFALFFRREAFRAGADGHTFHDRAHDQGQIDEARVAGNLSEPVFGRVFPHLAHAIAAPAPDAPLAEVRESALVFLYRVLFILYAEDRDLLAVWPVTPSAFPRLALTLAALLRRHCNLDRWPHHRVRRKDTPLFSYTNLEFEALA